MENLLRLGWWLLALTALAAHAAEKPTASRDAPAARPNVVFLLADPYALPDASAGW